MTAHPRWRSDPRCQAAAWQALTAGSRWSLYYLNGHFEDPSRAKPELTRVRLLELAVASDKPEPEHLPQARPSMRPRPQAAAVASPVADSQTRKGGPVRSPHATRLCQRAA